VNRTKRLRLPALYPILNVGDDLTAETRRVVALAQQLSSALPRQGVLQLRAKTLGAAAFVTLAKQLARILMPSQTKLIINDRVDVAAASGAGGVHLGDEDLAVADARRLLGAQAIIGYSTHSVAEVIAAADSGADYLGFGPVFASPTKAGVREARGIDTLAAACQASQLPLVAIGGVTVDAAPSLRAAGAASLAIVSQLADSTDPASLWRRGC